MSVKNVSQVLVEALCTYDVRVVFCVAGGSIHNILAELDDCQRIRLVPCYHEQGAVYAAEAYARTTGNPGVVLVTSGPGLTNVVTGINSCWVDGIPLFVIAGQVVEDQRLVHIDGYVRQRGVQESDTHGIVRAISKKSTTLTSSEEFTHVFSDLWVECCSGRMGPVVMEIPVDLTYKPCKEFKKNLTEDTDSFSLSEEIIQSIDRYSNELRLAKLPLVIFGNGSRCLATEELSDLFSLCIARHIPFAVTWAAKDLVREYSGSCLFIGSPGIFGQRAANYMLSTSDCILCIGTSFNYAHTGYRTADLDMERITIIDVDSQQSKRPELSKSRWIISDIRHIYAHLVASLRKIDSKDTISYIKRMSHFFREKDKKRVCSSKAISLINRLNQCLELASTFIVVTDMGTSFTCTHTYLIPRMNRLFTASGHAPMGWGLPGAIGAGFASPEKTIICLTGDGGLAMNVQELLIISQYKLNIKILVLNNNGYSTIMATTSRYHGRCIASDETSGICNPDFRWLARSYKLDYHLLGDRDNLAEILEAPGPIFIEVKLPKQEYIGNRLMTSNDSDKEHQNMYPYIDEKFQFNNSELCGVFL